MAANLHVCDRTNDAGEILEGEIILVGDATAAHELPGFDAELVQKLHEATLKHEFCGLVSTYEAVNQISGR